MVVGEQVTFDMLPEMLPAVKPAQAEPRPKQAVVTYWRIGELLDGLAGRFWRLEFSDVARQIRVPFSYGPVDKGRPGFPFLKGPSDTGVWLHGSPVSLEWAEDTGILQFHYRPIRWTDGTGGKKRRGESGLVQLPARPAEWRLVESPYRPPGRPSRGSVLKALGDDKARELCFPVEEVPRVLRLFEGQPVRAEWYGNGMIWHAISLPFRLDGVRSGEGGGLILTGSNGAHIQMTCLERLRIHRYDSWHLLIDACHPELGYYATVTLLWP